MQELGDDDAAAAVAAYRRIIGQTANAHGGHLVESAGDHAMCVFGSAKNALVAAAAIRAELDAGDWVPGTAKPEVKAAVHTGRLVGLSGGQLGSSAMRVVRLCDSAEPGRHLSRTPPRRSSKVNSSAISHYAISESNSCRG